MNRKRNTKARGRTLRQNSNKDANQERGVQPAYGQRPLAVNLSRYLVVPPSIYARLRFSVDKHITSAGTDYASYSWNINGLYDVDPALASTKVMGFTEWHSLFRTNQVTEARVELDIVNQTTEPTLLDVTFVQNSVGPNLWDPTKYGNAFSSTKTLSGKGGLDKCHISRKIDLAQLNGTLAYWGSPDYFQGTLGTNPGTPMQLIVACKSITGGADADVYAMGFIEFLVHFSTPVELSI